MSIMTRIKEWIAGHPVAALTLFMFVVFSLGTVGVEISRINIRFALMTQEMAHHPLGLFPTLNGHPYADYPSLYNFLSYLTSIGGRRVTLFTLALPTILLSCYVVAMTAKTAELIKPGTGLCAAMFSLLSYEYLNIFMAFSIDIPVAAAALTIVWSLLKFDFCGKALPIYAAMLLLAFAVRGPLGLILCGAVTAGVIIGARRWKALWLYGAVGAAAAAASLGAAYYAVLRQGGKTLWLTVADWQVGRRVGKVSPYDYFYYFTNAMGSFMPVTGFALAALAMKRRELCKPELAIPLLWALLPMVMLSIPGSKHLRYMTLLLPAFAIVAAIGYVEADGSWLGKLVDRAVTLVDKLILPAGLALTAVVVAMSFKLPANRLPLYLHLAVMLALLCVMYFSTFRLPGRNWRIIRCALAMLVTVGIAVPSGDAMWENSSHFVGRTEKLLKKRHGRLYLYSLSPDHDGLKVMYCVSPETRRNAVTIYRFDENESEHVKKMFPVVTTQDALATIRPEDVIILHEKKLNKLRAEAESAGLKLVVIDGKGRLGHKRSVAARLEPQPTK